MLLKTCMAVWNMLVFHVVSLQFIGGRGGSLISDIKKQWFKCWSDQFITNLNQGDGEGKDSNYYELG